MSAGNASCEVGQASAPEESTSRAATPGVESQHLPCPTLSSRPEDSTQRESTPHCHSVSERDSNDEAEQVKLKCGQRRATLRQGIRRSQGTPHVNSDSRHEAEAVTTPGSPRHRFGHRRRDGTAAGDDDMDHSPRGSEREQNDSEIRPPPSKRRKVSSPNRTTLQSATVRRTRSGGATPRSGVQGSAPGRKCAGLLSIPSAPSSQASRKGRAAEAVSAKFEERPVENAFLKCVTVNGVTTFQLQWSVGPCAKHAHWDRATGNRECKSPVKRSLSTKRRKITRLPFTPGEDDLLIRLKNQGLPWKEIHRQHKNAFPQRHRGEGCLQVRYCTKLKQSQSSN